MLAFSFDGIRSMKQRILITVSRCYISDGRLTACDSSRFIENDRIRLSGFLERRCGFEEYSVFGSNSVSYHDRHRSGKSERARAAYNKHRNSSCKSKSDPRARYKPSRNGHGCDRNHDRNEHAGNPVCDLGDWRFRR